MAGQGAHLGRLSQRQASRLFTSCCRDTLQSRHEGKIRTTDINREMQEVGHHSRHAKADRHGQRTASGPEKMGAKPSLTNTDTHRLQANHCRAVDGFIHRQSMYR